LEARNSDSSINIGVGTFINNGAVIIADKTQIEIGERCLIGPGFFACDSDFHGLAINNRSNGNYECSSVKIGSDVFIGDGVKVMKGVTIGDGAVIGSGSVVVRNVAPNTIHAGVPAKYIKDVPLG
jgi:maltose O-acetyltransferase